jgi:hypothetical protein
MELGIALFLTFVFVGVIGLLTFGVWQLFCTLSGASDNLAEIVEDELDGLGIENSELVRVVATVGAGAVLSVPVGLVIVVVSGLRPALLVVLTILLMAVCAGLASTRDRGGRGGGGPWFPLNL